MKAASISFFSGKGCSKCPMRMQKPSGCNIEQDWNIGVITKKCPILYLEEYDLLFKLWGDYHNHGIYPNEGGYLMQSTKLHKVFSIITEQFNIFSENQ